MSKGSHIVSGLDVSENRGQTELVRLIEVDWKSMPVVFCEGDSGTGKTITSIAAALSLRKRYGKIFYIREPQEVGKSLGFLPGKLEDKYGVYLEGLNDNLEHLAKFADHNVKDWQEQIEAVAPQYCRGRSFENAIVIVDEAQNLRWDTLQMLITRMGKFTKLVFLASTNQIDVPGMTATDNDFATICSLLREQFPDQIGYVHLTQSERSPYCAAFDQALTAFKVAHPEQVHNFVPAYARDKSTVK